MWQTHIDTQVFSTLSSLKEKCRRESPNYLSKQSTIQDDISSFKPNLVIIISDNNLNAINNKKLLIIKQEHNAKANLMHHKPSVK